MISNNDFRRILCDKSLDLSKEELEQIIDEELEKLEDIMDADLIEYCLDALNELNATKRPALEKINVGDTNGKRITHKFRKAFAASALRAILIV